MVSVAKLTRTDSFGRDRFGQNQQVVFIDNITHLGRSEEVVDCNARATPKEIGDARVAILIGDQYTSRNHALLYPKDGAERSSILDLNSMNGTYINGNRLIPGRKYPITSGDNIALGPMVKFRYDTLEDYERANPHYGLMVAHNGGNLLGVENDVSFLRREFERRGFEGNIETLVNGSATRQSILAQLDRYKRTVTNESIFLFYFSGHGNKRGQLVLSKHGEDREVIALEEICEQLRDFRGQKLLILDGCYTAQKFPSLPPRTAFIGNKGKGYEGAIHSVLFLSPMGYVTRALQKILAISPEKIETGEIIEQIRQDERIFTQQQSVGHKYNTVIVLPSVQD